MASTSKRCYYEILGLSRECTPDEIRSAYKKLALQRHPDKLIKTGISEEEATIAFQELVNAYEVLSDPRERAWYDSHRSKILFSDSKSTKSSGPVPDLFSFFSNSVFSGFGDTGKGFYKVYADIFGKIYAQEVTFAKYLGLREESVKVAPLMGNLESPYTQVSAFYSYWLGFSSVMDFCWADEYNAMAGPDRRSRRMMEEDNKKARKKAKREYNDTVRGLAEYVKKRDKRVIEMQKKKRLEEEKKREAEKARKLEAQRLKLERARLYEEPDWAKVEEEEDESVLYEDEDEERKNADKEAKEGKELYCVVCSKKFKSDKQWKNHEQSKKHREKVAELGQAVSTEEEEEEEEDEGKEEVLGEVIIESDGDFGPSGAIDELCERFENESGLQEEKTEFSNRSNTEEGSDMGDVNNGEEVRESFDTNEIINNVKEKASRRKSKKKSTKRQPEFYPSESHVSPEADDIDLMECNSRRNARKNRAAKREGGQKTKEEAVRSEVDGNSKEENSSSNASDGQDGQGGQGVDGNIKEENSGSVASDVQGVEDSSNARVLEDIDLDKSRNPLLDKNQKVANQQKKKENGKADKNAKLKDTGKEETNTRTKNTSKRKKQRGQSKDPGLSCETCGEDFDSRNKLHKHLSDTGHAALKSR